MDQETIAAIQTILKRCYSMPIAVMFGSSEDWRCIDRRDKLLEGSIDQIIEGRLITILPERAAAKVLEYDSGAIRTRFGVTW